MKLKRAIYLMLIVPILGVILGQSLSMALVNRKAVNEYQVKERKKIKFCPGVKEKSYGESLRPKQVQFQYSKARKETVTNPQNRFSTDQIAEITPFDMHAPLSVPPSAVEIPDGTHFTENTKLDQRDYYLRGLAYIDPNVLFVIERPCTIYVDSSASEAGFLLSQGVNFIAEGSPDNPIIVRSDAGTGYEDYDYFVKTDPNANSVRMRYCEVYNAAKGVWLNEGPDCIIENNIFWSCFRGVLVRGPMDVTIENNHFIDIYGIAIDIVPEDTGVLGDYYAEYIMKGNLINGNQYYGIWVDGTASPANVPLHEISNNLMIGSMNYAVVQANGYLRCSERQHNAYWDNTEIENPGNPFDDINPVLLTQDPFVNGRYNYPFILKSDCPLINTGSEMIWDSSQAGKFTCADFPDSNTKDIGVHYFFPDYSNAGRSMILTADLDDSWEVNETDLGIMADYWLMDYNLHEERDYWDFDDNTTIDFRDYSGLANGYGSIYTLTDLSNFANHWLQDVDPRVDFPRADISGDKFVNIKDFAVFASQWKMTDIGLPDIYVDVDSNNITRDVAIKVDGKSSDVELAFVYLDGILIGEIDYTILDEYEEPLYDSILLDTQEYANGRHELKVATYDSDGSLTISPAKHVNFDNSLYYLSEQEEIDNGWNISAFGSEDYRITVHDWEGSLVHTSPTLSGNINYRVPGSYVPEDIYTMAVEKRIETTAVADFQMITTAEEWEKIWEESKSKKYDLDDYYKLIIFLPKGSVAYGIGRMSEHRKKAVAEQIRWAKLRGWKYILLYRGKCKWKNFERVASKPSANLFYGLCHGNSGIRRDGILHENPHFKFCGLFRDEYIFANPAYGVPSGWESKKNVHFMHDLGFYNSLQVHVCYLNCCYLGKNDKMAREWIDTSQNPILEQGFFSWSGACLITKQSWKDWDYTIFHEWGESGASWWDAYNEALKGDDGTFIGSRSYYLGYQHLQWK